VVRPQDIGHEPKIPDLASIDTFGELNHALFGDNISPRDVSVLRAGDIWAINFGGSHIAHCNLQEPNRQFLFLHCSSQMPHTLLDVLCMATILPEATSSTTNLKKNLARSGEKMKK
jgi:hypothetical protein